MCRVVSFSNSEVAFTLNLLYSPLPAFSLHMLNAFPPVQQDSGMHTSHATCQAVKHLSCVCACVCMFVQ